MRETYDMQFNDEFILQGQVTLETHLYTYTAAPYGRSFYARTTM